jgi:putative two-component system response regulator
MSCAQAREIILAGGGSHFDPDVVAAFDRRFDAFASVAAHYADIDANALAA